MKAGTESTHIFFVKSGELALEYAAECGLPSHLGAKCLENNNDTASQDAFYASVESVIFTKRKTTSVTTVAIIGAGDVYDDAVHRDGMLCNKWNVVSMSECSLVYSVPRPAINAALNDIKQPQAATNPVSRMAPSGLIQSKKVTRLRRHRRDRWCMTRQRQMLSRKQDEVQIQLIETPQINWPGQDKMRIVPQSFRTAEMNWTANKKVSKDDEQEYPSSPRHSPQSVRPPSPVMQP